MKIALACDSAGAVLMPVIEKVLEERGIPYHFFGKFEEETVRDYPVFAVRAANAVKSGEYDRGILCCGTGVGISIAANKVRGIRCCCCSDCYSAKMSRAHNDANMLALGGRVIAPETAEMIVGIWLDTPFDGGRHQRRIDMFTQIEEGKTIE